MKIRIQKTLFSTVCAVALLGATNALATAYTSTGSGGNWNSTSTWTPNTGVPGTGDTAAIAASAPVSVSDTEAASSITVQKGATLTIATGGNLTVGGTITQSGGSSGTSTVTLSGGSGTLNLNAVATAFTSVALTPGTAGSTVNYGASGATVYAAAYDNLTLSGGGTVTVNSTTTAINLVFSSSTALSNASGKLSSITGNVTLKGSSTFTVAATTSVGGNFTVNTGAAYYNNNGNATLTIGGNVFVAGTFGLGSSAGNASTVVLTGSGDTISGGGTLSNQVLTVNGSYTLDSGTTISVGNKNAGDGPLGGTGSLVNQGTIIINYSSAFTSALALSSLNCSATGNTLVLNEANGTASTLPAIACYNLTLNPTGGGDSFNLGNLTAVGGNLTFGGSSGVASLVTAWPSSGISGQVIFNSPKGITFPSAFSIGGFNQSAGTVTVPTGGTLTLTGTGASAFTTSGGTFATAGSTVYFTGTLPVISGTAANFANLSISATSAVTNTAPLVVTNILNISGGGLLDVTALTTYMLSTTQSVINAGTISGNLGTAANSKANIFAETNGVYNTNTITGSLALNGTNGVYLDVNSTAASANDLLTVGGTLTLNNTVFNLQAPSAGASIDTANDYTLATAANITGTPVLNWVTGFVPANAANYSLVVSGGTNIRLHYTAVSTMPVITSIVPNFGSTNGGTFVTINGTNFLSNPAVTFGAFSANNITYVSSSQITVTTPAQPPGPVTVTVTDTDTQTATGSYTYILPPQPATGAISVNGANATIVWTGGTNESCLLMSSTNLALPLSNWAVVATNAVGASGLSTNVIPIDPSQPQNFYDLTIPYN